MKFTRHHLFVSGALLIMLFTFLYRFNFIRNAALTDGLCIGQDYIYYQNGSNKNIDKMIPIIAYQVEDESYTLSGVENQWMEKGTVVEVIYNTNNPSQAYINDFTGFWLYPVLSCALISIAWLIFSYGAFESGNRLVIRRIKKTNDQKVGNNIKLN